MTRTTLTYWRIAFALALPTVLAQQCYYPNGVEAPEKPCSSADGSACCPDKWECLDNGLCYYPPDKLHGRYSCTDKSWKAEGCPSNMCTYDMSASGGESITQCSDHNNQWCCNADAQHVNCCAESPAPRPFFDLADGKAYATVGASTASSAPNLATITGFALESEVTGTGSSSSGGSRSNIPQSTNAPSNTPSASVNAEPTTQLQTSVSSGTAGIQTVVKTVISTPSPTAGSATSSNNNSSKSSSKLPVIVGCAVGIPLALALVGILIWLLRKRSKQAKSQNRVSKPPFADEIMTDGSPAPAYGFTGGAKHNEKPPLNTYKSTGGVPELAGNSVGPTAPVSTINGRAELPSGTEFAPGTGPAHAPQFVGLGGGTGHTPHSSWGSAPGYGNSMNPNTYEADSRPVSGAGVGAGGAGSRLSELPATNARPVSDMHGGAVGAGTGAPPGGYIPYRPNNLVQPHQAQEMSTVTTPPPAELGLPSPPAGR